MQPTAEPYAALTRGVGYVDVSDRTQIELTGDDRAILLHNMCTQEIKKLSPGQGAEAFLTDAKGHVLAFVELYVTPDSIVLDTVAGQGSVIMEHFDRYIIREDVQLAERSPDWGQLLIAGEAASDALSTITSDELPQSIWQHGPQQIADRDVYVRRPALAGPTSWALVAERADIDALKSALDAAGMVACDTDTLDTVRIENRVPLYGRDITDRNLPQEVDRDATAINFNKGCYIGQETVARLDALGHVNKRLVAIRFDTADVPPAGTKLRVEDREVGVVTSSTFSPQHGAGLALAYVRYAESKPGSQITSDLGPAEVL